jgi:hypothetical protein
MINDARQQDGDVSLPYYDLFTSTHQPRFIRTPLTLPLMEGIDMNVPHSSSIIWALVLHSFRDHEAAIYI